MIKVVVVDDEALVRWGFELILRTVGDIDVVATADDSGAVSTIERYRPDVMLLDVPMPDVDGLTILRTLATSGVVLSPQVTGPWSTAPSAAPQTRPPSTASRG